MAFDVNSCYLHAKAEIPPPPARSNAFSLLHFKCESTKSNANESLIISKDLPYLYSVEVKKELTKL